MKEAFKTTSLGQLYKTDSIDFLKENHNSLKNKVNLILTSPPFPLNRKKKYGNLTGEEYKEWLSSLAPLFSDLLAEDGSIVIELGNSWEAGRPVQSTLHIESFLSFLKHEEADLRLCQEFVCYNPARLPTPAQWVTKKRTRVTDSYTHLWWMSKTDYPKADNRKVLRPYSKSMKSLLKNEKYNYGERPGEHSIGKTSFLKDNGGSIPHNLFELEKMREDEDPRLPNAFSWPNTISNDSFLRHCREKGIKPHPARMPIGLANFFVNFLTDPGDLVLDPFAGSGTTLSAAEMGGRRWLGLEVDQGYTDQAALRLQIQENSQVMGDCHE